jgi:phospholipid/cholesterol/gamma-HCH transport system substrate-binding protein
MGRVGAAISGLFRRAGIAIITVVAVIALVVVGIIVITGGGTSAKHLTAYFPRTVGLYTGNDVRILGVKIGHVDSITPQGSQVKVEMSYDGDDKVPANAKAVIVSPSIVSDRYVQLTPAYTAGAVMPDNASIAISRTRIPLELDEIFGNLDEMNKALGPNGANRHGALSRLVRISAANLRGNGGHFNRAFHAFSQAISTLAGSKDDLFSTIGHLQRFTTMLAQNDGGIRQLNANLATVGGQLAGERRTLGAALANLATALSAVNQFVSANKQELTGDIHGLTKVTNVLTKEKKAITEFTDIAPYALSDLGLSYDPEAKTLDTKSDTAEPISAGGPSGAVCQLLKSLGLEKLLPLVAGCSSKKSATTATTPVSGGASGRTGSNAPTPQLPQNLRDLLGVKP